MKQEASRQKTTSQEMTKQVQSSPAKEINSSKRSFLQVLAAAVGLGLVFNQFQLSQAEEKRRAKKEDDKKSGGADLDLPMVKMGEGMAASLNYVDKKSALKNESLKSERTGVKWDQQFCEGCLLFTAVGKKGSDSLGKCQLFQGHLVNAKGWCNSWAKKA